jgi:hypothetical protein
MSHPRDCPDRRGNRPTQHTPTQQNWQIEKTGCKQVSAPTMHLLISQRAPNRGTSGISDDSREGYSTGMVNLDNPFAIVLHPARAANPKVRCSPTAIFLQRDGIRISIGVLPDDRWLRAAISCQDGIIMRSVLWHNSGTIRKVRYRRHQSP